MFWRAGIIILLAIVPYTAVAQEKACHITYPNGGHTPELENCPNGVGGFFWRERMCLFYHAQLAYNPKAELRFPTFECEWLACDRQKLFAKYADNKPVMEIMLKYEKEQYKNYAASPDVMQTCSAEDSDKEKQHELEEEKENEEQQEIIDRQSDLEGRLNEKADKVLKKGMSVSTALKAMGKVPGAENNDNVNPKAKYWQHGVQTFDYSCRYSGSGCWALIFVEGKLDYWGDWSYATLSDDYPQLKKNPGDDAIKACASQIAGQTGREEKCPDDIMKRIKKEADCYDLEEDLAAYSPPLKRSSLSNPEMTEDCYHEEFYCERQSLLKTYQQDKVAQDALIKSLHVLYGSDYGKEINRGRNSCESDPAAGPQDDDVTKINTRLSPLQPIPHLP